MSILVTHSHPSINAMDWQDDEIVSVYNGVRIPTGRHVRRRKLGDDPWGELDPANSRLQEMLSNKKFDFTTLDNDELSFGVPRCDDGKFSVKAAWQANFIPRVIKNRIQRELYKRANKKLHAGLLGSVDTIVELATEPYAEDKIRFEAAKYILERLQGKTPEHVVHSQEAPWEMVFSNIQRGPRPARGERQLDQLEDGNTVEAEVVED